MIHLYDNSGLKKRGSILIKSYILKTGNNSLIICLFTYFIILIFAGITIIINIFRKKIIKVKEELYYRDEIFNTLGLNEDNVFWIYNTKSRNFDYFSPNFEKTLEFTRNEFMEGGLRAINLIPEDKRKKFLDFFSDMEDTKILKEDFEYIKPVTKEKCWIMFRIYPICKNGRLAKYLCLITDITKEKQSEKELKETLSKLTKANKAKKVFLSHMSHELKTPLNSIIGLTQIASQSMDSPVKVESCLNNINTSSRKLLTLINNILDISKIDSDKLLLVNEPFYLGSVLATFSSIINAQAELNKQKYTFQLNNIQDDCLMGDSLRLVQILENCLSNSMKFTPEAGEIKLEVTELERKDNRALFQFLITDTGKGMCAEFLKHIFDPFEQEDCSIQNKYGGTGIGMTIVKELVNLMGGSIDIKSKVNCGTVFTIQIGFLINEDTQKSETVAHLINNSDLQSQNGNRILLVEDNEINREITMEIFKNNNINVETAKNGYEAVKLFETSEKGYYDMIFMDIHMPEIDGFETAKLIRRTSHPDAETIQIIALTADDSIDPKRLTECGINDQIRKERLILWKN